MTNSPWKVTRVFENNKPETYQVDLGKFGSCNAVVASDLSFDSACLIASAPELLEALKAMLEWARRVKDQNSGAEILNAINAIAKAEGV